MTARDAGPCVALGLLLLGAGSAAPRPTQSDLDAARRRSAVMESEFALASTRKPYLVLDVASRTLRYRLMGMTVREIALTAIDVRGFEAGLPDGPSDPPRLAGIFTVREKEGDPRLHPLSAEQVEAGDDDENAANILPPEVPKTYRLSFKQPLRVQVEGQPAERGAVMRTWDSVKAVFRRLSGRPHDDEAIILVEASLDPATAAEVYRSIIPELRLLLIPPPGYILPQAGQEPPPKPKPPRAEPVRPLQPAERAGVPFQIPAPQEDGAPPPQETPPPDAPVPPPPGEGEPPGKPPVP
jgi:hypothetical protein